MTVLIFGDSITQGFCDTEGGWAARLKKFLDEKTLLNQAQKYSQKIIFVGLTPVDESLTNPFPGSSTGKSYKDEFVKSYDQALQEFCEQNNVDYIKLLDQVDIKKDLEDGLHPNSKGHQKMFEIIINYLQEIIF